MKLELALKWEWYVNVSTDCIASITRRKSILLALFEKLTLKSSGNTASYANKAWSRKYDPWLTRNTEHFCESGQFNQVPCVKLPSFQENVRGNGIRTHSNLDAHRRAMALTRTLVDSSFWTDRRSNVFPLKIEVRLITFLNMKAGFVN
jgi:hypothetical protein